MNTVAYPISKGRTKKLIGATLFEFIVVGRNSRISINVSGDEIAEGFIVLNKIS